MTNFWHWISGDLDGVLIDPAEDWSQARWSRDHFPSRELIFIQDPTFELLHKASRPGIRISKKWWKTDLKPSPYIVFHVEFKSAVQIGPKPTQDPIFNISFFLS